MQFSSNEDYVIGTDSSSNGIVVWDSLSGEVMRRIKGVHESPIHAISTSPFELEFMTAGDDSRGRFWNISY